MSPENRTDERYRALLDVSEKIASHRDLETLFHELAQTLHPLVHFDYLNLILYDPARDRVRLHVLETSDATPVQPGLEFPADQSPAG